MPLIFAIRPSCLTDIIRSICTVVYTFLPGSDVVNYYKHTAAGSMGNISASDAADYRFERADARDHLEEAYGRFE